MPLLTSCLFTYASWIQCREMHTRNLKWHQVGTCWSATRRGSVSIAATLQISSQQPTPAMAQPLRKCPMLPSSSAPVQPSQARQTGRRRHSALSWLGHLVKSCAFSSHCGMRSIAQTCTKYFETLLSAVHSCQHQHFKCYGQYGWSRPHPCPAPWMKFTHAACR